MSGDSIRVKSSCISGAESTAAPDTSDISILLTIVKPYWAAVRRLTSRWAGIPARSSAACPSVETRISSMTFLVIKSAQFLCQCNHFCNIVGLKCLPQTQQDLLTPFSDREGYLNDFLDVELRFHKICYGQRAG